MLAELAVSVALIGLLPIAVFAAYRLSISTAQDPKMLLFDSLMNKVADASAQDSKPDGTHE